MSVSLPSPTSFQVLSSKSDSNSLANLVPSLHAVSCTRLSLSLSLCGGGGEAHLRLARHASIQCMDTSVQIDTDVLSANVSVGDVLWLPSLDSVFLAGSLRVQGATCLFRSEKKREGEE